MVCLSRHKFAKTARQTEKRVKSRFFYSRDIPVSIKICPHFYLASIAVSRQSCGCEMAFFGLSGGISRPADTAAFMTYIDS